MSNERSLTNNSLFFLFFFLTFSERSQSYQQLPNYKRIPELYSLNPFNRSHFFDDSFKARSQTYLTPKMSKREDS